MIRFKLCKLHTKVFISIFLSVVVFYISCHSKPTHPADVISYLQPMDSNAIKATNDSILANQGKSVFLDHCETCHNINKTENWLVNIVERMGETSLKLYITKQDSLVKAKDKYVLGLKRAFGNQGNAHNFKLTGEEMNAIIAYLAKYST